jgi:hypothetical protein
MGDKVRGPVASQAICADGELSVSAPGRGGIGVPGAFRGKHRSIPLVTRPAQARIESNFTQIVIIQIFVKLVANSPLSTNRTFKASLLVSGL